MAKRKSRSSADASALLDQPFDISKFDQHHQVGGIRTATLDHPGLGAGQGSRVAMFNTGSPLRFTVGLDRGGDILDAFFAQHSLAYLSLNGYKPPSPAYHADTEWLTGWGGGLMTCCGPRFIGRASDSEGNSLGLHGHHSNTPAEVEMLVNPDPHAKRLEMVLGLIIRDTRMFGPNIEVRRQIQCVLGEPEIQIHDQITNRGDERVEHNWLYHCNFGYPLLDEGAKAIFRGRAEYWQMPEPAPKPPSDAQMNRIKTMPGPLVDHAGGGERGLIVEVDPDDHGQGHVGMVNSKLGLAVEMIFPVEAMPRIANWQHFGPRGCYVNGIEPFAGSLIGLDKDSHPKAEQHLEPGETRRYRLTFRVHSDRETIREFLKHDGKVVGY